MRRGGARAALATLAVVASSLTSARAQPQPTPERVAWPRTPAPARVGDWLVLEGRLVVASCCSASTTSRLVLVERVAAVTSQSVELEATTVVGDARTVASRRYSPTADLVLSELLGTPASLRLTGSSVAAERRTLGGRELDTRRLTIRAVSSETPADAEAGTDLTLWLSPDVPGPGLVALRIRERDAQGNEVLRELRLAGFGHAATVDGGRSVEALLSKN